MSDRRTLARRCAAQALYQWQMSRAELPEIERQFLTELRTARTLLRRLRSDGALTAAERDSLEELLEKYCLPRSEGPEPEPLDLVERARQCGSLELHEGYFKELLHQVPGHLEAIDAAIGAVADRPLEAIDPVERAILRLSGYELLFKPEIPYRVAVNEGIDLAKHFGATQSYKYVNGILDRIARTHRAAEIAARRR